MHLMDVIKYKVYAYLYSFSSIFSSPCPLEVHMWPLKMAVSDLFATATIGPQAAVSILARRTERHCLPSSLAPNECMNSARSEAEAYGSLSSSSLHM